MPQGVHMSKRKSGCQQRKDKKAKLNEIESISGSLLKYVKVEENHHDVQITTPDAENTFDSHVSSTNSEKELNNNNVIEDNVNKSKSFEPDEMRDDELKKTSCLDILQDVSHWRLPLSENCRVSIMNKWSCHFQNKDGPFEPTLRQGIKVKGEMRCLSTAWFSKEMPNGQKILRTWMVYSPISKQLYCFCCRLFASSDENGSLFVSGFFKWWKLNPKVVQHENSEEHLENLEKWKLFETGLKLQNTIDSELLKNMESENKKWRNILTRLLDITLFLSKQNLAFRSHDESENSTNRGNFLEMVKLLSKYDVVLKEHTMRLDRHVSYLSPETQNEFLFFFLQL
ncbi:zinc finger MYM-type protein 5-like [Leptopilina boulardi]|uniref:zinc finger MYM-type protein 5-like n=1 Tax=Leptopilina boulardi TaxID=63433 RepID=UPI0021F62ADB|nr:zinc finger MYM-type protein 5-like [Leptopilina boulardi]